MPRRRRRTRASRRRRGRQLQFDWKEDVRLADANGEVFEFNVWSGTLGHSRRHRFIPTRTRTTDDLLACLLDAFLTFGGIPEECVTDNMSALVAFSGGRRRKVERAWEVRRGGGLQARALPPRDAGDEGQGREREPLPLQAPRPTRASSPAGEGLLECVARIELRSNEEPNETTGLPPSALFMREKESLRPIGNARLLQSMVGDVSVQTVPPTMLVRAAGRQWSVPRRCIGRRVTVVAMPGGQVRVRMGGEGGGRARRRGGRRPRSFYREEHYMEALDGKRWADGDIRAAARANLDLLDALGGGGGE